MKVRIEWVFTVLLGILVVLILEVFVLRAALKQESAERQKFQSAAYARHIILKEKYGELAFMIGQARIEMGDAETQMAALYNELGFTKRHVQIKFFPIVVPKPGTIFDEKKWNKPKKVKGKK